MLDHLIMLYRACPRPGLLLEIGILAKEIMEDSKNSTENKIRAFFIDLEIPVSDEQVAHLQEFLEREKEDGFAGVISAEICDYMHMPLKYYSKIKGLVTDIWNGDEDLSDEPCE